MSGALRIVHREAIPEPLLESRRFLGGGFQPGRQLAPLCLVARLAHRHEIGFSTGPVKSNGHDVVDGQVEILAPHLPAAFRAGVVVPLVDPFALGFGDRRHCSPTRSNQGELELGDRYLGQEVRRRLEQEAREIRIANERELLAPFDRVDDAELCFRQAHRDGLIGCGNGGFLGLQHGFIFPRLSNGKCGKSPAGELKERDHGE